MAGRIDANVTADTTKLIRMPDSLHGGSGFAALGMEVGGLSSFEPMRSAPVFREGELKVKVSEPIPALNIRDYSFGPMEAGRIIELPMPAAVYLLCKKAAVLC